MTTTTRRAFPRIYYEAPIKYAYDKGSHYFDATMYNSSKSGMYFEPDRSFQPESKVYIVMINHSPFNYGPEAYRSYKGIIKWCGEMPRNNDFCYGVGVQFLTKSHEVFEADIQGINRECDLCGGMTPYEEIQKTKDFVCLCQYCFKHLESLPKGKIKEAIERFLIGNVI